MPHRALSTRAEAARAEECTHHCTVRALRARRCMRGAACAALRRVQPTLGPRPGEQTRRASAPWPAVQSAEFNCGAENQPVGRFTREWLARGIRGNSTGFSACLPDTCFGAHPLTGMEPPVGCRGRTPHRVGSTVGTRVLNPNPAHGGTEKLMTTPHLSPRSFGGVAQIWGVGWSWDTRNVYRAPLGRSLRWEVGWQPTS